MGTLGVAALFILIYVKVAADTAKNRGTRTYVVTERVRNPG